jgi:hypothetical protein
MLHENGRRLQTRNELGQGHEEEKANKELVALSRFKGLKRLQKTLVKVSLCIPEGIKGAREEIS